MYNSMLNKGNEVSTLTMTIVDEMNSKDFAERTQEDSSNKNGKNEDFRKRLINNEMTRNIKTMKDIN